MTIEEFKNKLEKLTADYWAKNKKPLLLSGLIPMLERDGVLLSEVIGDVRIKEFIQQTSGKDAGYKLVIDPAHKARVGVIPSNESYSYLNTINTNSSIVLDTSQKITMDFLALIKQLPKDEADQVHIPIRILAKLLNS